MKPQDADRLHKTDIGYCEVCDAEYRVHREYRCINCDTPLSVRIDVAAAAFHAAVPVIQEIAASHAPDHVCRACLNDTPLAYNNAGDAHKIDEFDRAVAATSRFIGAMGEDWHFVAGDLADVYEDAYYDNAAPANECDVCHDFAHGNGEPCGHDFMGDACPLDGQR